MTQTIANERKADPFLGEAEVMVVLGFSSEAPIRRAAEEGQIPRPIVVGRRRLWLRSTWERFLATGEVEPKAATISA
jgi:predicted DNA-binding transcriptional regulator AlpA